MIYPFRLPFRHPLRAAFKGVAFGMPIPPPCYSNVLTWHTGFVQNDTELKDFAYVPGKFPFDIVQSGCLELDGVDTITTATDHGSIVSSGGTSTLSYDGATISGTAGTAFDITFSDGAHYRCAEVSPTATHIFTDDGLHSGEIVPSTTLAAVRAGRQDDYPSNIRHGWWEKAADDTKYPYPVSGFSVYHPGNTWNSSESGFKFSDPVPAAIIAMDTDYFFVNTDGEALTFWQRTLEELGAELQTNNHFTTDLSGYSVTTNWAWESPGVARHSTGSVVALTSSITLTDAVEYEITFTAGGSTAGTVTPYAGSGAAGTARGNGTFTERLTCTTSTDFLLTPTTDFDGWVDNVSVRAVDPLVNYNTKYMFGSIAPKPKEFFCYATAQTGVCLEEALVRVGVGEWKVDDYSGEFVYDDFTGEKIYVEL